MGKYDNINVVVEANNARKGYTQTYETIVLKPNVHDGVNILTEEMFTKENAKYVIKWDYDLGGASITIPENCIISMEGGSLTNGTLVGQNTKLINESGDESLVSVSLRGSWKRPDAHVTADEEDLTINNHNQIQLANKVYDGEAFSGMGRVYLRKNIVDGKNILDETMMSEPNTIYVIQYDYDLDGETIKVPENCVLKFEGGSLENGKISLQDTRIENCYKGFKHTCILSGSVANSIVAFDWYFHETSTREQLNTFINGERTSYGVIPSISGINDIIYESLYSLKKPIKFNEGIFPFLNGIPCYYGIDGSGYTKTLLWFPQSKGLLINASEGTVIKNLTVEAWEQALYINAVNAAARLSVFMCHLNSYNSNGVEGASTSGPIWGCRFLYCDIWGGNQHSCIYKVNSTTNSYIKCGQTSWWFNGNTTRTKGRAIAFWHNSTCFSYQCGFDAIWFSKGIIYIDSDSEFSSASYVSLNEATIEGTGGLSDDLPESIIYNTYPGANKIPVYWNNNHIYGNCVKNDFSNCKIFSIEGSLYIKGDYNDLVWGNIVNGTQNILITVSYSLRQAPEIYILGNGATLFDSNKERIFFMGARTFEGIKKAFPTLPDSYINYILDNYATTYVYGYINMSKDSTIIYADNRYNRLSDGSYVTIPVNEIGIGTASNRPTTNIKVGYLFYDKTINKQIYVKSIDGATEEVTWVESDGAKAGVLRSGTTTNRPAAADIYVGFQYLDKTLGAMITWNGSYWANENGFHAAVVRGELADRPTSELTAVDEGYQYYATDVHKAVYFSYNNGSPKWYYADGTDVQ